MGFVMEWQVGTEFLLFAAALGSSQPLPEMSTRNLSGGKGQPADA
jgi:hypothetical protein